MDLARTLKAVALVALLGGFAFVLSAEGEAPAGLPDIVYEKGPMGKITFSHAKHVAKSPDCTACHATTFKNQRTADWPDGEAHKACGTCHKAGGLAFDVAAADRCATCHKP